MDFSGMYAAQMQEMMALQQKMMEMSAVPNMMSPSPTPGSVDFRLNPTARDFRPMSPSSPMSTSSVAESDGSRGLNPFAKPYSGSHDNLTQLASGRTTPESTTSRLSRKAHSTRVIDEKVVVCTPWYPDGVEKSKVKLGLEVEGFCKLVALLPSESAARTQLCEAVEAAAKATWEGSETVVYGSFAVGTSSGSSAVDLSVEGCGDLDEASVCSAMSFGTVKSILCEGKDSAFAQVECKQSKVVANVSLHKGTPGTAGAVVDLLKGWLREFPAAVPAHAVLRQVLVQTSNLDVCTGGLSSHALLCMVIALCRRSERPAADMDAAALIIEFCRVFGNEFDYNTRSIDPRTGQEVAKCHDEAISVLDPIDPTNNLATGCTRLFAIRAQLQHCFTALMRWSTDPKNNAIGKRGYKGRTPLSGILSHQKLWNRAEIVSKEVDLVPDQCMSVASPSPTPSAPSPSPSVARKYSRTELYRLASPSPPPKSVVTSEAYDDGVKTTPFKARSSEPINHLLGIGRKSDKKKAQIDTKTKDKPFELFSTRDRQSPSLSSPGRSRGGLTDTPVPGSPSSSAAAIFGVMSYESLASLVGDEPEVEAGGENEELDAILGDLDAAIMQDLGGPQAL